MLRVEFRELVFDEFPIGEVYGDISSARYLIIKNYIEASNKALQEILYQVNTDITNNKVPNPALISILKLSGIVEGDL